jgi:DNA mismatch repair protein MSH4
MDGSRRGRTKRTRPNRNFGALDLAGKVAEAGGQAGFGLEGVSTEEQQQRYNLANHVSAETESEPPAGLYGGRSSASVSLANLRRTRLFGTPSARSNNNNPSTTTPAGGQDRRHSSIHGITASTPAASVANNTHKSDRSRFSRASAAMSRSASAIRRRSNSNSGGAGGASLAPAVHIVCAISENLARETCVASLDAGSATTLQVTKQGNGQTYAETLAYLEILKPNEVLLNEGRRHSQLARKVLDLYNASNSTNTMEFGTGDPGRQNQRRTRRGLSENGEDYGLADEESAQEAESRYGSCGTSTVVKFISRSCFDQTKGAELLRKIAREETCDASVVEEYILLSSAYAVLHYTQQSLGASFSKGCLHLSINAGGNNRMAIDRSTLLQLELLVNSKTGKVRDSLIGTIDCTKTTVGSRLLRTNLMSPPTRADTINSRLELVETFLAHEDFFYTVLEHLSGLPDVDKMLTNIALVPRKNATGDADGETSVNVRIASKGISALVCIKTALAALPGFAGALQSQLDSIEAAEVGPNQPAQRGDDEGTVMTDRSSLLIGLGGSQQQSVQLQRHHLLRAIIFSMMQPGLAEVFHAVSDVFTETTTFSRNTNAMRHQECFALKCEDDSMMSVIRRAFLANVDDIYRKADQYAEVHGLQVSVRYSTSRGYFLSVPAEVGTDLPQVFLQPSVSRRCIACTTEEINSLNTRAQDNVTDLLLLTHDSIQQVLETARSHYDSIAALCDAVALLDMCHSFADNVTLSRLPWCRPVVSERVRSGDDPPSNGEALLESGRAMMIRNGRYCIDVTKSGLASSSGIDNFIPNDTFAADGKNFTLVTGINGSGKSTYLKQVAIIVILAHCGSYVPAEQASIPIRDQLCTRIGNADDQEHNISTFMLEMKETALICNHATDGSLVLVDELGRATSNEDGVAIAWSVSEYLLKKGAMTFFVTHYPQLSRLGDIYPNVQNMHLEASVSRGSDGEIRYTHKVKAGRCKVSTDYGVELAAACGWPSDVLQNARSVESNVQALCPDHDLCELQSLGDGFQAYKVLGSARQNLKGLISDNQIQSFDTMRSALVNLHQSVVPGSDTEMFDAISRILFGDWSQRRNSQLRPDHGENGQLPDHQEAELAVPGPQLSTSNDPGVASLNSAQWEGTDTHEDKFTMASDAFDGSAGGATKCESGTSSLSTSSSESDSSDESSVSSSDVSLSSAEEKS